MNDEQRRALEAWSLQGLTLDQIMHRSEQAGWPMSRNDVGVAQVEILFANRDDLRYGSDHQEAKR